MKWLLLGALLSSQSLIASTVDDLSFLFYKNKISATEKSGGPGDQCYPHPDIGSCLKVVCANLPSYLCDDADEIAQVRTMCKGNFGSGCITGVFKVLPKFQYDDLGEMAEITTQCRNVYGSNCFDFFASKVPRFQLDEKDEAFEVLNYCRSASYDAVDCAKFTCSRLPSFQCDELDEISAILNSCN